VTKTRKGEGGIGHGEEQKVKEEMATTDKVEVVAQRKAELVGKNMKNRPEKRERWAEMVPLRAESSKIQ
jgi:hypothetical protein